METVTNIASAASRAIWGEGTNPDDKKDGNETLGKEPVAGELGDVKSGEPYDKGNVGKKTPLPAKSTLTSNPKPATTEISTSSDPSKAAVLLPESESTQRETPTNLLTTADKPSTTSHAAAKLPSEGSESDAKPLTFTKSDPADGAKVSTGTETKSESLEEKASGVSGTTGFDTQSPDNSTGTSTSTTPPLTGAPATTTKDESNGEGLREENVGSTGLLEEKRVKPESASEPKVGETSTTPKSLDGSGSGHEKEKKSLKEKIKEKLHRHKD